MSGGRKLRGFSLGWANHALEAGAVFEAEAIGPADLDLFDAANALDPRLAVCARLSRGSGQGSALLRLTLPVARQVDVVALLGHSLPAGTVATAVLLDDAQLPLFESEAGTLWEAPNTGFMVHGLIPVPPTAGVKIIELPLSFPDNSAWQATIGAIWCGPVFDFVTEVGFVMRLPFAGELRRSRGQQGYPRRDQAIRELDLRLPLLTEEAAFGYTDSTGLDLQGILYRLARTEPCLLIPRTSDENLRHRLAVYGALESDPEIANTTGDHYESRITVRELL